MISVYLDVCCFNRLLDDQTQDRVRLEAEAVSSVLNRLEEGELLGVGSTVILIEIDNNRDLERKAKLQQMAIVAKVFVRVEEKQNQRATELQKLGFHFFDALHVACAEAGGADLLLTTDDRFLRLATRVKNKLTVRVVNPADWLMEIINDSERNDG